MALPAYFAQFNMVEACLLPLRAMLIAPFSGTQQAYVAIEQVVALCSQNPLKYSIAGSPKESESFVLENILKPRIRKNFLKGAAACQQKV